MENLKKRSPIAILGGVIVVGLLVVGGLYLFSNRAAPEEGEQVMKEETQTGETPVTGESFVGKLKDALDLDQSMKCTWRQDEDNYAVSYIANNKIRTEATREGEKAYSIIIEDCSYTWEEGAVQGFKMCFEPTEAEEVEEMEVEEEEAEVPEEFTAEMPDYEYNCEPAVVSDSMFDLPAGVEFMSMEDLMGGGE